jgi:16S rRNA (cytosine1402-N4)-methyltransferase
MRLAVSPSKSYFLPMNPPEQEENKRQNSEDLHLPVLLEEVIGSLQPRSGKFYIDATLGLGGHAVAILDACSPEGMLLGIDQDVEALRIASRRLSRYAGRYEVVHSNFSQLKEIAAARRIRDCDGILVDLGVSSLQLDSPERGFSFQQDGPLDMRMDRELPLTANEIVNYYNEKDLANLIYQLGEEPLSRKIARAIVRARPLHSTRDLASVIARTAHSRGTRRIHPATKTFQALRIYVNDELNRLAQFLQVATQLLASGGRILVVSFHSLEDRIVKETLRGLSSDCICPPGLPECVCGHKKVLRLITRKPIIPSPAEVGRNPRSRSAKLRVAEKL